MRQTNPFRQLSFDFSLNLMWTFDWIGKKCSRKKPSFEEFIERLVPNSITGRQRIAWNIPHGTIQRTIDKMIHEFSKAQSSNVRSQNLSGLQYAKKRKHEPWWGLNMDVCPLNTDILNIIMSRSYADSTINSRISIGRVQTFKNRSAAFRFSTKFGVDAPVWFHCFQ